jgi:hypothetical protein
MKLMDVDANLKAIARRVYNKVYKPDVAVVGYVQHNEEVSETPNNSVDLGPRCDPSGSLFYHYESDAIVQDEDCGDAQSFPTPGCEQIQLNHQE